MCVAVVILSTSFWLAAARNLALRIDARCVFINSKGDINQCVQSSSEVGISNGVARLPAFGLGYDNAAIPQAREMV